MDNALHELVLKSFDACGSDPWYVPAALLSLEWSKHVTARDAAWDTYLHAGRRYLLEGAEVLDELLEHAGRFGREPLRVALRGYQALLTARRRDMFSSVLDSPAKVRDHQRLFVSELLGGRTLDGLSQSNTVGIGPWLGLAPYKILLLRDPRWWDDPAVSEIAAPLGIVVVRALKMLARVGVVESSRVREFSDAESFESRVDGFANVYVAQELQLDLARAAACSVLHINSGLYDLGYQGN